MDQNAIKDFVRGQMEAAERARELRAQEGPASPSDAFDRAMELWELRPDLAALPRTPAEERDITRVREAWIRLKARWVP